MQTPNCSVCGRPGDPTGGLCAHCGNRLTVNQSSYQPSRSKDSDGEGDFGKYLAVGVFAGAIIAASLVLFLIFSSGRAQKGRDIAPAEQTLIQAPTQPVPAPSASPQDEGGDDRRPSGVPVRRGLKKPPSNSGDDSKRKRQDIIETPGKNPKMTQY